MKIKTSELQGAALDRMVAQAAGYSISTLDLLYDIKCYSRFNPSTDWAQGGPIIEQERICIDIGHDGVWLAYSKQNYDDDKEFMHSGPTPLIAAMRCYCCAKLGEEIDIPKELYPCQQPNI